MDIFELKKKSNKDKDREIESQLHLIHDALDVITNAFNPPMLYFKIVNNHDTDYIVDKYIKDFSSTGDVHWTIALFEVKRNSYAYITLFENDECETKFSECFIEEELFELCENSKYIEKLNSNDANINGKIKVFTEINIDSIMAFLEKENMKSLEEVINYTTSIQECDSLIKGLEKRKRDFMKNVDN